MTSEPYTEPQRLQILLDAIEAAIVQRADLEGAVFAHLSDISAIDFQPDAAPGDADVVSRASHHRIDRERLDFASALQTHAKQVLAKLRGPERDRS